MERSTQSYGNIVVMLEELFLFMLVILLGLACGSFITMATYRIPRELPVGMERSKCPSCKHSLGVRDLWPVFSWLFQKGKCRYCSHKIHIRYPLIELATALCFGIIFFVEGPTLDAVWLMLILLTLAMMTVIDIEYLIIPDRLQIMLFMLALIGIFMKSQSEWVVFLFSAAISGGVALFLRNVVSHWKKQESLGLGDVKLMFISGLFLHYSNLVFFFLFSGILGIIFGLIWEWSGKGKRFPFGPALATSLFLCLLIIEGSNSLAILR